MNHVKQLSRESAALAVIDMQEAFRPVMPDFTEVASRIALAVEGARLLEVPVIVTEQYPKGLKHTAQEIVARMPVELKPIEKFCFSSCGAEDFVNELSLTYSVPQLTDLLEYLRLSRCEGIVMLIML